MHYFNMFIYIFHYISKNIFIMKFKLLVLSIFSFLIISCSSDNASNSDIGITTNFLPLSTGNYWTYDVYNHATVNTPESFGRDSLYVSNDTLINGVTFKKMKTKEIASGFFSGTIANNGVRIDGNKVKVSGSLAFNAGLPSALSFSVFDFIIAKEDAMVGEILSTTNGSFEQTFSDIPLTFTYQLKSVSNGSANSYAVNGITFSDITKTKVILNLKISTFQTIVGFPNPIEIPIMNAQDVLVSEQFYSKNIGLIYNHTLINYNLNSIPNITLPIPQSGSQTQEEFLDAYQIN